MEIVIKIPDEVFEAYKHWEEKGVATVEQMLITHGTVLPKGHGRLIDADKLDTRERGNNSQRTMWWKIDCIVKHAKTIVEADKENDNEQ